MTKNKMIFIMMVILRK